MASRANPLENPALSLSDPEVWDDVFGDAMYGSNAAGERVSRHTALQVAAIFRGTNLIATTSGKLPCHVKRRTGPLTKERDTEHQAYRLLRRNSRPWQTAYTFRRTITAHAILHGNGYAYILRDKFNRPLELRLLDPTHVSPVLANGELFYVTSIGGNVENPASEFVLVDAADMIHIRGLGFDGIVGYDVIRLASQDIGTEIAATKFAGKFFSNGASGRVVVEVPAAMTETAYGRLQKSWGAMTRGLSNAHKAVLLEEGAKAKSLSIDPAQAQLIESRQFSLTAFANWLGIPPHKLGVQGSKAYGSVVESNQEWLGESVDPWLIEHETEYGLKLLTFEQQERDSHACVIERKALLTTNMAHRAAFYRQLVGVPIMSPNEARNAEDMPSRPDGDEIARPLNMAFGTTDDETPDDETPDDETPDDETTDDDSTRDAGRDSDEQQRKRSAALRTIVVDTVRRMSKRMLMSASRGKTLTDDVVDRSLQPFDALLPVVLDAKSGISVMCSEYVIDATKRHLDSCEPLTGRIDELTDQTVRDTLAAFFPESTP